eukprot:NODE_9654_length_311_cov_20.622137_g7886_i0.p2 GENE.NODE_9654_length_311_cov_20.622137_g7886_i0~~NODE_9654_length_311_cov_20.622137_g7886_i0.p2  ORF type:complete len:63 (+),score=1.07 NODE_9654_length_311_cov_20.622137_g7886_i0:40-228(+)
MNEKQTTTKKNNTLMNASMGVRHVPMEQSRESGGILQSHLPMGERAGNPHTAQSIRSAGGDK